tara:strand:+ start:3266 stop:3736 length:471 start_codon:yes stop_codon:yes gene_type:complete
MKENYNSLSSQARIKYEDVKEGDCIGAVYEDRIDMCRVQYKGRGRLKYDQSRPDIIVGHTKDQAKPLSLLVDGTLKEIELRDKWKGTPLNDYLHDDPMQLDMGPGLMQEDMVDELGILGLMFREFKAYWIEESEELIRVDRKLYVRLWHQLKEEQK